MAEIRVLVADDEPLVRAGLVGFLTSERDVAVVGEARDGTEAAELIRSLEPDVVFLDVQMPGLDGFGVLDAIVGEAVPAIVFVTAFDAYALRAFDVHAVDYLLKPFDERRFRVALERVKARLFGAEASRSRKAALHAAVRSAIEEIRGDAQSERLLVKKGDATIVVRFDEIDWVEAADNYVRIHTANGRYMLRETITALERRLNPRRFARIHRSAVVNISRVRELRPAINGETTVVLSSGVRLTLSRTFRDEFRARLDGTWRSVAE